MSGGPNEIWSFGQETFELIERVIRLRERIQPYIDAQMRAAHAEGLPPMCSLFVDFPNDTEAWSVEDEFMLGPDVLVASVAELGLRRRDVYLPPGRWTDAWVGTTHEGPGTVSVEAPLDRIPVFLRAGSKVPIAES